MTKADWKRFLVVMARYEGAFPNQKKLNAAATADRFEALRFLDIEQLEGAVADTLLATGDFFPSAALQFDLAVAWGKAERARRADQRATTHGLPSRATLSAEEELEIETKAHADRARLRRLLAEPFVDPPRPRAGRVSSTPEPLKEILARTMPKPPDDPQQERPT